MSKRTGKRSHIVVNSARRRSAGYSLVEMLVAVAITGVAVLSVMTLFALGRSNVYSGRQMTHGISVGTRILEDLSGLALTDLYTSFDITGTTALAAVTVPPATLPESSYDGSIVRTTNSIATAGQCTGATLITFANDPSSFLRRWYCQMQTPGNKLPQASITLVFTPRIPIDTAAALSPTNASVVRVRTIIRWTEGLRRRQLVFDTNKYNRPLPE
jgi:prepilin-type N-terminal cleavage/methylation domain-containing protein